MQKQRCISAYPTCSWHSLGPWVSIITVYIKRPGFKEATNWNMASLTGDIESLALEALS